MSACKRGGTTRVSDEEEMDAGKTTFSGPDCTGCGTTGASPDMYRRLPNTRERKREYARYTDSMHASYVQKTKERNAPDTNKDTNMHNLIYKYYKSKIQLRLRARLREVRLQQQSPAKPPIGELSGLSRQAGSCAGDRAEAKPL